MITPTISAICWTLGVAPTMWPVLRSCITSPAIAADEATIEAIRTVANIRVEVSKFRRPSPMSNTNTTVNSSVAIVIPETGELEDPTTPAI